MYNGPHQYQLLIDIIIFISQRCSLTSHPEARNRTTRQKRHHFYLCFAGVTIAAAAAAPAGTASSSSSLSSFSADLAFAALACAAGWHSGP
mmetsp:Transcript_23476/g.37851  ORF Transcript_23476/g.37851 Transcript_23476/m.37851 type:complete len:91 (-) Transcript_23476:494-766(-)